MSGLQLTARSLSAGWRFFCLLRVLSVGAWIPRLFHTPSTSFNHSHFSAHTMSAISQQLSPAPSMDWTSGSQQLPAKTACDSKGSGSARCQEDHNCSLSQSQRLHHIFRRLLPALLVVLSLIFVAGLSILGLVHGAQQQDRLLKRQVAGDGSSSSSSTTDDGDTNAFVDDHLYLLVSSG